VKGGLAEVWKGGEKWSLQRRGRYEIKSIKRGGIFYGSHNVSDVYNIRNFLEENTEPGDYVYFFPNEAVYYFLFDRNNPTRYAISYFAVTSEQRRELIGDLEKNKPEYVIYSLETWRVDNIPEYVQVPEVVQYLKKKYKPHVSMGNVLVLKRA
jgi:hypothetical protein